MNSAALGAVTRRRFIAATAAVALVGACSDDDDAADPTTSPPTTTADQPTSSASDAATDEPGASDGDTIDAEPSDGLTPLTPADFAAAATCVALPAAAAGPFPLDEQFVRRDITEGYPGHPLRLGLRVIDQACEPLAGAAVEIWHTDATGDYSAFADGGGGKDEAEGSTFLRGTQMTDADGIAEFQAIYPGWYPGRTPHIHVRIHVDDALVLTSQLYFDDDYTAVVYGEESYAPFGPPDTTNASDILAGDVDANGSRLALDRAPTHNGDGTLGLLNIGLA